MLFAGHSGTGSCPVFGVGEFRSLKNRSWRTALHARRKENVFGKLIFSFQGSERENRHGSFLRDRDQDNRRCHTAEKVPFTIHDIFRRFINGGKSFVYKLFTIRSLSGYYHNKNGKGFILY